MQYMNVEGRPGIDQPAHAGLVVERAEEASWERVKTVRLAALAESPSAFGSTLAEESGYGEAEWRAWCRGTATYLAVQDEVPVGIAAGVGGTSPEERKLVAMWVDPGHRGRGVSVALLAAVRDWADRDGATRLILWVTRGNEAAAALYKRAGFSETGDCKPLPSDTALIEDQLALDLR